MAQSLSSGAVTRPPAQIAFLFLGEPLLVPHLLPIVEALCAMAPDVAIDLWVRTPDVEAMIAPLASAGAVRIRHAPGFGPEPAPKLAVLARLLPHLIGCDVVVCAELTSLWLPRLLPLPTRFIKTSHGVGSMSARDDRRRRAAYRLLVPSALERETYLARGLAPDQVVATGYVKSAYRRPDPAPLFANDKPVLIYAPHWQRHRSSWWDWGRDIVAMLAAQDRYNVILAPHQRLEERDPEVRAIVTAAARLPHVHADLDSAAQIDGSYLAAADVYLGDTSSQIVEYLARPRPCVFLNSQRLDWRNTEDHDFWRYGEVIDDPAYIEAAIAAAPGAHHRFVEQQEAFARASLGQRGSAAPRNAAREILAALRPDGSRAEPVTEEEVRASAPVAWGNPMLHGWL